jgi:hypothetical protein
VLFDQLEQDVHPLLGGEARVVLLVGAVRLGEATEGSRDPVHDADSTTPIVVSLLPPPGGDGLADAAAVATGGAARGALRRGAAGAAGLQLAPGRGARVATTPAASALPHTAEIFDEQVFAGRG